MTRLDAWCLYLHRRHAPSLIGVREGETSDIQSSPIASVDGRFVTTSSGSMYDLGAAMAWYPNWLSANGMTYSDECPIPAKALTLRQGGSR